MAKLKTCRICKIKFTPTRAIQPCCANYDCMVRYAQGVADKAAVARKKRENRQHKEKLDSIKPKAEYMKDAQRVFNTWIRECRDYNQPCISCGTTSKTIQYCAGHFVTCGASSALRFNEDNVHRQCNHHCNLMKSGNINLYREALIKKIGQDRVDALLNDRQLRSWTIDELKELKVKYKNKIKEFIAKNI